MKKLPVVTQETAYAVRAEMERQAGNQYIVSILKRIEKENGCIAEFISQFAMSYPDPVAVSVSGALVYRLLESQLEADELKRQIG